MKATLKLDDGREFAVDVNEEILKQIEKPVKKTGYEKVAGCDRYYLICGDGNIDGNRHDSDYDDAAYAIANYYSDRIIAKNNARADTLLRKLRRFAVEHRKYDIDWDDDIQQKWQISYNYEQEKLSVIEGYQRRILGTIPFESKLNAEAAVKEFNDELVWYFTEYKDSL